MLQLLLLLGYVIILMHHVILCFVNLYMSGTLPAITNLLQEFADDGMESRTTPILEGGDDEDIAKMESRTTPIREGEDEMRTSPRWTHRRHGLP